MSAYIYSTLTASNEYRGYTDNKDVKGVKWSIEIKGGANVASKNLITPYGVLTVVTDEELLLLQSNTSFNNHVERGFITVEKKKSEVERVAKNMKKKDSSAPLTPEDFAPGTVETVKE
jgi:hypothetical protein